MIERGVLVTLPMTRCTSCTHHTHFPMQYLEVMVGCATLFAAYAPVQRACGPQNVCGKPLFFSRPLPHAILLLISASFTLSITNTTHASTAAHEQILSVSVGVSWGNRTTRRRKCSEMTWCSCAKTRCCTTRRAPSFTGAFSVRTASYIL